MEYVQITLLCCRHALVLIRHGWTRLADTDGAGAWRGALRGASRLKADG